MPPKSYISFDPPRVGILSEERLLTVQAMFPAKTCHSQPVSINTVLAVQTLFATLYSLRLFWENDLVRIAFGAPSLRAPIAVITYLISVPYVLFFRELLGRGWKSSIQIWLWVQLVFAPIAILALSVARYSSAMGRANNILVVGGTALALAPALLIRAGTSMPDEYRIHS